MQKERGGRAEKKRGGEGGTEEGSEGRKGVDGERDSAHKVSQAYAITLGLSRPVMETRPKC